jgi:hypothetical protein
MASQSGKGQVVIAEWQLGVQHACGALSDRKTELEQAILRKIAERTWGRIRSLSVEVVGRTVIIHGRVDCFYLKQLALQGVFETLGSGSDVQIELNIGVESGTSHT